MRKYSLPKYQRIKEKKVFEELAKSNNKVLVYPLLIKWLPTTDKSVVNFKVGFAVSKKRIRKAVERNKIRRRLREAFRLKKPMLIKNIGGRKFYILIIYMGGRLYSFNHLSSALDKAIEIFLSKINKNTIQ